MNIRKLVYIVKDQLKNGSLNANLADLTSQFNHFFPAQPSRLQAITQYAVENTPYYDTYKKYNDFKDYPVLDKSVIKRNYDDFVSIPYKDCIDSLHKVTTSGSYGTPFTFYLNSEKRQKMIAELYYFGKSSNFDLGIKHAHIMAQKKPKFLQLIQNQVTITVKDLTHEWCRESIHTIKNKKVKVIIGYPSAISRLAIYLERRNIILPMDGIITVSEVLTSDMRQTITKSFKCNPVSRYTTNEFGVLGVEDLTGDFFSLNQCNFLIEILSLDNNQPVELGQIGRIVVTDLFNKSMPLIRYDTGDMAKPSEIRKGIVTKIESVEGRRLAIIRNTKGEMVSSFEINKSLIGLNNIIQYQFSQEHKLLYKLKLVIDGEVDELHITKIYKDILGLNAQIVIDFIEDIPPQRSGKRPYILQNYYNE